MWADWLGVPRHTFRLSSVRLSLVDWTTGKLPGCSGPASIWLRSESVGPRPAGVDRPEGFGEENLYPDARWCLSALREQGLRVGLAGNWTARAETILRALSLSVDRRQRGSAHRGRQLAPAAAWSVTVSAST